MNIDKMKQKRGEKIVKQLAIDCIALIIDVNTIINVELLKVAEYLM